MNDQELDNLLRREVMQRVDAAPEARKFEDLEDLEDLEDRTIARVRPDAAQGRRRWLAAAAAGFMVLLGGCCWAAHGGRWRTTSRSM